MNEAHYNILQRIYVYCKNNNMDLDAMIANLTSQTKFFLEIKQLKINEFRKSDYPYFIHRNEERIKEGYDPLTPEEVEDFFSKEKFLTMFPKAFYYERNDALKILRISNANKDYSTLHTTQLNSMIYMSSIEHKFK